jgi:hypothetical protein
LKITHKPGTKEALADEKWEIEKKIMRLSAKMAEIEEQRKGLLELHSKLEKDMLLAPWENPQARDYQFYSFRKGNLLHAGVEKLVEVDKNMVIEREQRWQTWRKQYLLDHPELNQHEYLIADSVTVFPVENVTMQQNFEIP